MKRRLIIVCALVAVGLAVTFYFLSSGSAEVKRDRYLKEGREYFAQGKVNEAVIMFKNAIKADPASAEAHHELGLASLRRGDIRGAFSGFQRATNLKPGMVNARYQLGNLYLIGRDIPNAKKQLDKIREQNQNPIEGQFLAAKIALIEISNECGSPIAVVLTLWSPRGVKATLSTRPPSLSSCTSSVKSPGSTARPSWVAQARYSGGVPCSKIPSSS